MRNLRILGLCGSLRALSYNRVALQAAQALAPAGMDLALDGLIGELPLFNPDHDQAPGDIVLRFRDSVRTADALLIATPEYAHGVSGVIKNALDWLVSMESFPGKPVALINASPRASIAQAALREILSTMSAELVPAADMALPMLGSGLGLQGVLACPERSAEIRRGLDALALKCRLFAMEGPTDGQA